jgi:quercetin dioxygenase-like cupin family protein
MLCIPDRIHEAGEVVVLEWKDPDGLRGCGFFTIKEGLIAFQRGYWDRLSFQRLKARPGRLVLVEFDTTDGPEDWCEAGHIGYVLEGALSVSFDGDMISYVAGDVMLIPAGPSTKHRATSITQGTQLLMIEDA